MRDLKEIIKIAVGALEDKKGEDIKVLDISDISSLEKFLHFALLLISKTSFIGSIYK